MTPVACEREERLLCGGMSNNFSSRRYRCKEHGRRTRLPKTISSLILLAFALDPLGWHSGSRSCRRLTFPILYYYREMYLPAIDQRAEQRRVSPNSKEVAYSMAGSLWRQRIDFKDAQQLTDGPGYDYSRTGLRTEKTSCTFRIKKMPSNSGCWIWQRERRSRSQNGGAVNVSRAGLRMESASCSRRLPTTSGFTFSGPMLRDGTLENAVRLTGETKSAFPRYYYSPFDMEISPVWTRDGQEILFVRTKDTFTAPAASGA